MLSDPRQPLLVQCCAFSARQGWRDFSRLGGGLSNQQWTLLIQRQQRRRVTGAGEEQSRDHVGKLAEGGFENVGTVKFVATIPWTVLTFLDRREGGRGGDNDIFFIPKNSILLGDLRHKLNQSPTLQ